MAARSMPQPAPGRQGRPTQLASWVPNWSLPANPTGPRPRSETTQLASWVPNRARPRHPTRSRPGVDSGHWAIEGVVGYTSGTAEPGALAVERVRERAPTCHLVSVGGGPVEIRPPLLADGARAGRTQGALGTCATTGGMRRARSTGTGCRAVTGTRYRRPGTGRGRVPVRAARYRCPVRPVPHRVPFRSTGTARSYRYRSAVPVRGHCPPVPVRRVPGGCTAVVRTARRAGSTSRRGRASGDAW